VKRSEEKRREGIKKKKGKTGKSKRSERRKGSKEGERERE